MDLSRCGRALAHADSALILRYCRVARITDIVRIADMCLYRVILKTKTTSGSLAAEEAMSLFGLRA